MTKDEITAWALANGWQMIDGAPSLTKPAKPHPAIVRLVLKATVATVNGSQLATDDCIVVGWHKGNFLDASGNHHPKEYLMDLNCNSRLASPGHPGNSLASPTGRAEKHDEVIAAKIAKNPALPWCDEHAQRCQQVCESTGMCEYEAS